MLKQLARAAVLATLLAAWECVAAAAAQVAAGQLPDSEFTNAQRVEGWRADLKVLAEQLPKHHIDMFHALSEEQWREAVAELDAAIPGLSDDEVIVRLMQLVNRVGDSHTALNYGPAAGFRFYPLGLYWFSDGLYIVQTTPEYEPLLGARLTAIDGKPVEDAVAAVASVIPHENESQLRGQAPYYLALAEVLWALGVAHRPGVARFSVTAADGEQLAGELTAIVPSRDTEFIQAYEPSTPLPYYAHEPDKLYWTEWLPENQALYLAYNHCAEDDALPLSDFTAQVMESLAQQPVQRLIIDLRANGGGNSSLLDPLIDALAADGELRQRGHILVLIGRRTFSSAILNAVSLQQKCGAVLVGEPSGGKPSHYGEVESFQLPISGLEVTYSTKYFDVGDPSPSLQPDVLVEASFADFIAGADSAMQAALDWQF